MRQHQWAHGALAGCLCPKWQTRSAAGQAALDTLAPRRHRPCASCARTAGRAHHASEAQFCRDPGSSRGPSDLQSDALPTELSRLCFKFEAQSITEENNGKRVSFIGKQWRCHHGAAVSLLAHVSAITFGTRDICLPFFIRRVFPDPSSPLNPNSVREHVQIPEFGSRLLFS